MNLIECLNRRPGADWSAFENRYRRRIRRTIVAALRGAGVPPRPDDIDDLVQEVYCRLLATGRRARVRAVNEAQGWRYVSRTVRSAVLDHQRSRRAEKRQGWGRRVSPQAFDELVDRRGTPEAETLAAERAHHFERWLADRHAGEAGAARRQALVRVLAHGWTSREAAAASLGGLSAPQIDTMVHRVRRRLAREGIVLPRRSGRRSRGPAGSTIGVRTKR